MCNSKIIKKCIKHPVGTDDGEISTNFHLFTHQNMQKHPVSTDKGEISTIFHKFTHLNTRVETENYTANRLDT